MTPQERRDNHVLYCEMWVDNTTVQPSCWISRHLNLVWLFPSITGAVLLQGESKEVGKELLF